MKRLYFSLFLFMSLLSCGRKEEQVIQQEPQTTEIMLEDVSNGASSSALAATATPSGASMSASVNKKIVRSGHIAIESKDVIASKRFVDGCLKKYQGYYEQESSSRNLDYINYTLVARIPAAEFERFIQSVENGKHRLTEKSIKADDISLQYFDTESRLKSKRSYLEKYQQMVTRTNTVKELLEIQEQIRLLQEEIDSQEVLMRSLKDQVAFSTLTIQLFEYQANLPMGTKSFWSEMQTALASGWKLMASFFLAVLNVWPFIALFILCLLGWRRFRRSRRRKCT
ncbi:DUF4349 domain-containing protein [Sphingobacterium sp. LRF_L2]|uniref:DUF4349 domain-containing protein n=1 Tax=Sphingobacterium sp. LRF_L2 TaxID=3369421 RepID=UPI003F6280C2